MRGCHFRIGYAVAIVFKRFPTGFAFAAFHDGGVVPCSVTKAQGYGIKNGVDDKNDNDYEKGKYVESRDDAFLLHDPGSSHTHASLCL